MPVLTIPTPLFIPPAVVPPDHDPAAIVLAIRSPGNAIEGWSRAVFEDCAWRPPFPGAPLFIANPAAVRTVLRDEAEDFPQGALFRRMMRPAWGEGMLIAQGRDWRFQRHAAAGAFRPADIASLTPAIASVAQGALNAWLAAGGSRRVDVAEAMTTITFDVIVDTMLSGGEDFDRARMRDRMRAFFDDVGRLRLSYFLAPDAWHDTRPEIRSLLRPPLLADVQAMIARRRAAARRGDLIDLLLAARDPATGAGLSDALLADNLLGFILAGHETTALALTWALYLAAAHPPTLGRIRDEVTAVAGAAAIGAEHAPRLIFTRQVISEALRLYPPAYLLTRVSRRTTVLAGATVRAGTRINIPIYALHRHRRHWPNPDAFDPDRFGPGAAPPDRFVYLPFGAGPRICLGAAFAMVEAVVILATLLRGADFEIDRDHKVWPVAGLALRPKGGMPLIVSPRAPASISPD